MAEAIQSFSNPFTGVGQGGGLQLPNIVGGGGGMSNPFGLAQGLAELRNTGKQGDILDANLQAKQLEMMAAAREAAAKKKMGLLFAKNFNQETGSLNWNKFFADTMNDPETIMMAPDIFDAGLKSQGIQAETAGKIVDAGIKKSDWIGGQAAALQDTVINKGKNVRTSDVAARLMDGVAQGVLTKQEAEKYIMNLPPEGPKLNAAVEQIWKSANLSTEQSKAVRSRIETITTNAGTFPVKIGPEGMQQMPGGVVQTPSVETLNTPMTVEGPEGQQVTGARQDVLPTYSADRKAFTTPGGGASEADPTAESLPTPMAPDSSGLITGRAPRDKLLEESRIKDVVEYEKELRAQSEASNVTIGYLQEAERNLKQTRTGGGTTYALALGKGLQALGAIGLANDVAGGDIAALEQLGSMQTLIGTKMFRAVTAQPNRDLAQNEFKVILGSTFGIDKDPRASFNLIKLTGNLMQLKINEAKAYAEWKRRGAEQKTKTGSPGRYKEENFNDYWTPLEHKQIEAGFLRRGTLTPEDWEKAGE